MGTKYARGLHNLAARYDCGDNVEAPGASRRDGHSRKLKAITMNKLGYY